MLYHQRSRRPSLSTWHFLKVVCGSLALAASSAPLAAQDAASKPPNLVIILADDMGYGDIQVLNAESQIPTPHLNQLSSQGVTFSDAHSPSAVCTPTRYGLINGRYCWRTKLKRGVLGGYSPPLIEPDRITLAEMLRQQGYRTGAVGKWHLGMDLPMKSAEADTTTWQGDPGVDFAGTISDGPLNHGFDSYFGVSASLDMAPYVYIRDDHFTMLPSIQQEAIAFPHFIRSGPRAEDFIVSDVLDKLTQEAVAFVRDASAGDQPYFLYLPLTGPHKPTQPHQRFRGKTGLNEYGDFVHQVDWSVGQVLAAIRASDEADNTVVVFTSDNGSYMVRYDDGTEIDHVQDASVQAFQSVNHRANGPLRGTKADVWEAGHRVPFIISWPKSFPAGETRSATVCLTDIYATFAEIVGAKLEDDQAEDSFSIIPLIRQTSDRRAAPVIHHSSNGMFAIRDGRWKLVCGNGSGGRQAPKGTPFEQPFQLFDLEQDLGETHDVASQHADVVQALTKRVDDLRKSEPSHASRRGE